ncbi:MAG: hypothetical protein QM733_15065 [Ilumatobacteraceae bacterium]
MLEQELGDLDGQVGQPVHEDVRVTLIFDRQQVRGRSLQVSAEADDDHRRVLLHLVATVGVRVVRPEGSEPDQVQADAVAELSQLGGELWARARRVGRLPDADGQQPLQGPLHLGGELGGEDRPIRVAHHLETLMGVPDLGERKLHLGSGSGVVRLVDRPPSGTWRRPQLDWHILDATNTSPGKFGRHCLTPS